MNAGAFSSLFRTWHDLRLLNGYPLRMNADPGSVECDMDHSALLERLCAGKLPLSEPPPRHYSYPWYALADEGFAHPSEVRVDSDSNGLIVDQARWEILERPKGGWTVGYKIVDSRALKQVARERFGFSLQRLLEEEPNLVTYKLASTMYTIMPAGHGDEGRPKWRIEKRAEPSVSYSTGSSASSVVAGSQPRYRVRGVRRSKP